MAELEYDNTCYPIESELTLGRQKAMCDIAVKEQSASRKHCKVFAKGSQFWVEDLGSANGTKLNGVRITEAERIRHGDRIGIGKAVIVLHLDSNNTETGKTTKEDEPVPTPPQEETQIDIADLEKLAETWSPEQSIGQLIGGYRLQNIIGTGSIATVYNAKQLNLNRDVAVKIFHPKDLLTHPKLANRIIEQTKQVGSVADQAIAQVHECGEENGLLWYSMELVEGDFLRHLIKRDGQFNPAMAMLIIERAAKGLKAAHSMNLIHRGVSVNTIMVSNEGRVKVLELGVMELLREMDDKNKLSAHRQLAMHSLSPEQIQKHDVDHRSDIYSLGCVLFHMLAGKPPFYKHKGPAIAKAHVSGEIPSLIEHCPRINKHLDSMIGGMLAKNPEWRFSDMDEVLTEIAAIREELGAPKATPTKTPSASDNIGPGRPASQSRQERAIAKQKSNNAGIILSVFIILGIVAIGGYILSTSKTTIQPQKKGGAVQASGKKSNTPTIQEQRAQEYRQQQTQKAAPPSLSQSDRDAQAALEQQVAELAEQFQWQRAETLIKRYIASHKNELYHVIPNTLLERMRFNAQDWYAEQKDLIPRGDTASDLRARLNSLTKLRNLAIGNSLFAIDAQYRATLKRMEAQLAVSHRDAALAIESGEFTTLPAIYNASAAAFANTDLAGLHTYFSDVAKEASTVKWLGNWPSTQAGMEKTTGNQAISAAACFILYGEIEKGTEKLLADPTLESGALLERRNRLIAKQAALLSFDDPTDLFQFEMVTGSANCRNGAMVPSNDNIIELYALTPLDGTVWDISITMHLGTSDTDEVVASIGSMGKQPLNVRFINNTVTITDGLTDPITETLTSTTPITLRFAYAHNRIRIMCNSATIAESACTLPGDNRLHLLLNGQNWRIDELQAIGSEQ